MQAEETWTTRRLLSWMTETFTRKELESPRRMAEMLMSHVLGCQRLRLYMEPDRPANELERKTLRDMVTRALKHEPVQYLVGEEWFFGLPLTVDRRVLIPRPETATIVEQVLLHARSQPGFGGMGAGGGGEGVLIADIGTGSGCMTVALLTQMKGARAVATDISADALDVARINAVRHGVADRVDFVRGDLTAPLREFPATRGDASLHYIVSNPPYIPDDEWDAVEPNVKDHEPHLALRGGVDGLDLVRRMIADGPALLKPGGMMLIEVAAARAGQALELARGQKDLADARIVQDFAGLPRVIVARRA